MSANYIDFDPELQALGYRAKTWDGRYFTIVAPSGEHVGTTPFESDIKKWAEDHRGAQFYAREESIPAPILAAYHKWLAGGFDPVFIARAIEDYLKGEGK